MENSFVFPDQRVSYSEKTKNNDEWAKQMLKYLFQYSNHYTDAYNNKLANYRLFNNIIDQKDFEKDCNITGIDVGQFKDLILPYNKTYNKINSLLGQELKRPFKFMAVLINPEGIRKKETAKSEMLQKWIEAQVQLAANKIQMQVQQKQAELQQKMQAQAQQVSQLGPDELAQVRSSPEQDQAQQEMQQELQEYQQHLQEQANKLIPPEEIEKWFTTKYRDSREILGNKLMNYLIINEKLKDKKNDGFKHGLISGEEHLWVGVEGRMPTIKILNSLNVFYQKASDTKFIQDGLFAGYKNWLPVVDVLNLYGEYLSKEEVDKIKNRNNLSQSSGGAGGTNSTMQYAFNSVEDMFWSEPGSTIHGQYGSRKNDELAIMHAEWVSQRRVGFLTFTNEFNEEQTLVVDENFSPPKTAEKREEVIYGQKKTVYYFTIPETLESGETVENEFRFEENWIPQVWEGVMIGGDIFCCIGPRKHQYFSIHHPNKHKLGYHGVVYNNMNTESVSLMDRMKPYQYLYFIVMHKLKKLIASDRGKVYHLDQTMIPDEVGLEKTLYYLEELNIDLYNPLQSSELPGGYSRSKVTGSTDRSNMQYILQYVNLLNYLDQQIGDAAGVPKPVEGQTSSNQAVTNAQSDIQQSSVVTEIMFNIHNKLWEDALNSLLSVARKFYKENNIAHLQYILDDLSIETLNMSEDDLEESDLGIYVTDSIKENYVFEVLGQISQALIQNDKANFSHIISILEADSLGELKRQIRDFERQQKEEAAAQGQQQSQMQRESLEYQRETMMMREKEITEREITKAKIDVWKMQQDIDTNDNYIADFLEAENFNLKVKESDRKNEIEREKLKLKEKEVAIKDKIASKPTPKSK